MRILYTGAFRFPNGDAAALRVLGVGRVFSKLGHEVSYAGWEKVGSRGPSYRYEGYRCHSQAEFWSGETSLVARLLGFFTRGRKTLKWLRKSHEFDLVVAYNPPALFAFLLLAFGRGRGIAVALDSTEWYESTHLPGGRFGLAALENWFRMRVAYPRFSNVICISSYLKHHFAGRNVAKVPPIMEANGVEGGRPSILEGVNFLYAGDAGLKDKLATFIAALPELQRRLGRPVRLELAGMDWAQLAALLAASEVDAKSFEPFVACHGRVPRDTVRRLYARAHFSILFREPKRYALAGFPTKAAESWSMGCPLVTNAVGDLAELINDGANAILLDQNDIAITLAPILKELASEERYDQMRLASVSTFEHNFTVAASLAELSAFLGRIEIGDADVSLGSEASS